MSLSTRPPATGNDKLPFAPSSEPPWLPRRRGGDVLIGLAHPPFTVPVRASVIPRTGSPASDPLAGADGWRFRPAPDPGSAIGRDILRPTQSRPGGTIATTGRPLQGKTIVVTRPREQASELVETLEALGARVMVAPMIRIDEPTDAGPLHRAVRSLADFDWIVFTSVNGVKRFWVALREAGLDTGSLARLSICAIGEATARAIEAEGASADLVPEQYVAEAVVQRLASGRDLSGARILLPRAENARDTLPVELGRLGAIVRDVPAYRTVPAADETTALKLALESGEVDMVTFTSGSTARSFAEQVTSDLGRALVATIGPVTSSVTAGLGWVVALEAVTHTAAGLADAIVRFYRDAAAREAE